MALVFFFDELVFMAIAALAFFKRPADHAARALFLYAALFLFLYPFLQFYNSSLNVLIFPVMYWVGGLSFSPRLFSFVPACSAVARAGISTSASGCPTPSVVRLCAISRRIGHVSPAWHYGWHRGLWLDHLFDCWKHWPF